MATGTDLLLSLSDVVHVASAAFPTGGVLYAAYAVFPAARADEIGPAAFERSVDGVLGVTRWMWLALPATGAYQSGMLHPLPALFGTTRGHPTLGMLALWDTTNGLLERAVYRMWTADENGDVDPPGVGRYMAEGFVADDGADVLRLAAVRRPYVTASVALSVLLLVGAALLAGGIPG